MFFDALTMACVAEELRRTVLGGRVQRVLLVDNLSVGLEIYAAQQRHYLLASGHAELGRLLLSSEKLRRGVESETGLLLLLRKHVRGARLAEIEQPPFERVLRLEFDHPKWGCSDLMVEIMGRHSNVILVDGTGRILDSIKRVTPEMSPMRPVLPGRPYEMPPPQAKLSPADLTEYRLRQILASQEPSTRVWQALVRGLLGTSPLLAREATYRALGHVRVTVAQVDRITPLLEALHALLVPLEDPAQWHPTVAREDGQPVAYAPYPVTHRGEPDAVSSISRAIECYAEGVTSDDPYAAAKRPIREALERARGRLERRRQALERSLAEAEAADRWRQWGEWILAYAHTVVPGQQELLADTGDGDPLVIPLEPARSAVDNAQAYFARYRKAQRAVEEVPVRLREATLALRDLEQLEVDLELAANRPEVLEVREALLERGHLPSKKRRRAPVPRSEPLTLESPDGLTLLVGRNSRQNDQVTFRLANGNDLWFHAQGVPGAHVVVRRGGQEVPDATIRRAAELAAHFSPLRDEADVIVVYTERRHVRRVPGAAPGLVTYRHEGTIRVVPKKPSPAEIGG